MFDCLPRDLLSAKLQVYGFGKDIVKLLLRCLKNRTQRIKIGSTFSE